MCEVLVLSKAVCDANKSLMTLGLCTGLSGNASGIDRAAGIICIKPRDLMFTQLTPEQMVEVDMEGRVLRGDAPSVDLPTHLVLYRAFPEIGGIVHTHSHFATCWAQARKPIPCLGTTHADYFHGEIPLTDALTEVEVEGDYEYHTGKVIARAFRDTDPLSCPAVLVAGHGPFVWGRTIEEALQHAIMLEEVAKLAWHTLALNPVAQPLEAYTREKHFFRTRQANVCSGA